MEGKALTRLELQKIIYCFQVIQFYLSVTKYLNFRVTNSENSLLKISEAPYGSAI